MQPKKQSGQIPLTKLTLNQKKEAHLPLVILLKKLYDISIVAACDRFHSTGVILFVRRGERNEILAVICGNFIYKNVIPIRLFSPNSKILIKVES